MIIWSTYNHFEITNLKILLLILLIILSVIKVFASNINIKE